MAIDIVDLAMKHGDFHSCKCLPESKRTGEESTLVILEALEPMI